MIFYQIIVTKHDKNIMIKYLFETKKNAPFKFGRSNFYSFLIATIIFIGIGCGGTSRSLISSSKEAKPVEGVDYFLPKIDLNNWKVTLPIGKPSEVKPPAILDYPNVPVLKDFMYNDSTDGSLVFYTHPGASTRNSSYSRTELREQMVPGKNNTNWTFTQGGRMKGTLSVAEVSKEKNGKPSKVIIMQIHGRLTNEQRDLIGEDDNNAPPVLKIYWDKGGRIRVKTKELKDINVSETEMLKTSAWTDDDGHNFKTNVGNDKFTLEVIASDGKLEVILNEEESVVYENIHMQKWSVFENYFKAGNYLQSKSPDSFAKVKYYDLTISH